ncbi:Crp/Fnr family transcriptional regulator [Magnetofaba australis]|uniref:Putative CRP/FNR family transcriptional regulator n=1 Tax=Magnetofaba australis IT-1 TaxID=1434232 RepID=A0A1Y2K5R0_9PROT|nr:Crp/Fnr family transcriptional regulator [Magnetofaba australis]OSM04870.1 putative CRP/FNR family transcriptional regulator [Magnetofaba australis IT-1]
MVNVTLVQRAKFFEGLSETECRQIAEFCEIKDYADGERVLEENGGAKRLDLRLIISGEVAVGKKALPTPGASEVGISAIGSELYGEISWLLSTKPSAGLVSKGRSRFLIVDGEKFYSFCAENPQLGFMLMERIASVLAKRTCNLTEQLVTKDAFSFSF